MPGGGRESVHRHIAVLTQVDDIEIGFENARFGVTEFKQEGQRGLVDFSAPTPFASEKERPGKLLSDRAAALSDTAVPHIRGDSARDADHVHAAMLKESPIFGHQHRVHDEPRVLLQRSPELRPVG